MSKGLQPFIRENLHALASEPVTAVIADDEPNIAQHLVQMLTAAAPEIKVVSIVHDGASAMQAVETHQPSVIFLDIRMPGINGVDVATRYCNHVHIIFITAYEQHVTKAFEQGAVDYLLKPIIPERLEHAIRRLYERLKIKRAVASKTYADAFCVAEDNNERVTHLISCKDIQYIRSQGSHCFVRACDGRQGLLQLSLAQICEHLNPVNFVQVHRCWIVNRRRIKRIERQGHGAVLHLHKEEKELRATRQYIGNIFSQNEMLD